MSRRWHMSVLVALFLVFLSCHALSFVKTRAFIGRRTGLCALVDDGVPSDEENEARELKRWEEDSKWPLFSKEWAAERGLEPGYGGLWPGNPDAKKYKVTIKDPKTGDEFTADVPEDRYIYFAFEEQGITLPVVNKARMCRQGCCTTCTVKVEEGRAEMQNPLGLLKEMRDEGFALSCCAYPRSDMVVSLQDEDEMYVKQWSEGFEGGGVEWGGVFPDEDG